jgi:hypothetical protein
MINNCYQCFNWSLNSHRLLFSKRCISRIQRFRQQEPFSQTEASIGGSVSSSGHSDKGSRPRREVSGGGPDAVQQCRPRCSGDPKPETAPHGRGPCLPARVQTSLGPQGWSCWQWWPHQGAPEELAGRWQHQLNYLTEEREHAQDLGLHSSWRPQKLRCLKRVHGKLLLLFLGSSQK